KRNASQPASGKVCRDGPGGAVASPCVWDLGADAASLSLSCVDFFSVILHWCYEVLCSDFVFLGGHGCWCCLQPPTDGEKTCDGSKLYVQTSLK
uniref:Uncharacterized protein n=1 Tax=Anopheles minimus TaxID=112268 RepID=A0A182WQ40_9DIPT